jgi:hypothetical protein
MDKSSSGDLEAQFHQLVKVGQNQLAAGDVHGYESTISQALLVSTATEAARIDTEVASGQWFDVPSLRSSGSMWAGTHNTAKALELSSAVTPFGALDLVDQESKMNGSLGQVRPYVVSMLQQTIQLGQVVLEWSSRFPQPPSPDKESEVSDLQQKSLANCTAAQASAARAKNSFSDFQKEATAYQQDLERNINRTKDDINGVAARAESDMNHIEIPWYVYMGGVFAVTAYLDAKRREIRDRVNSAIGQLEENIKRLRIMEDSGVTLQDHSATWISMCECVSLNLGTIYNILEALNGQVTEDPVFYSQLMKTEWSTIIQDASEVLSVIQSGAPITLSAFLMPAGGFAMARAIAPKPNNPALVQALLPSIDLSMMLKDQANNATQVWISRYLALLFFFPTSRIFNAYSSSPFFRCLIPWRLSFFSRTLTGLLPTGRMQEQRKSPFSMLLSDCEHNTSNWLPQSTTRFNFSTVYQSSSATARTMC